ncbi:putative histidine phosphotransferase HPT1p [Lasiosphaeris hirsuta]|uniref:Histidine phosphotransferase HPT1p n=1 Tax=Lasiosphaeris hirsuta TaxID=260670 RepID=A0AA39ZWG3_9PEZI|nr:putative histidine phosphotransferase HPT1p [Lasiosphaeris hirsuta]
MSYTYDRDDEDSFTMANFRDHVDRATFDQILEMDEDGEHDFSEPLVFNFFDQAEETFGKMDEALARKDLDTLSQLGHFLKGSSATLGFIKIRDSCQVIQQYGHGQTVDGLSEPNEAVCLGKIKEAIKTLKTDMVDLEKAIKTFFDDAK